MFKYYIIKYKKKEQSFLAGLNSMDDKGNIKEPYTLVLRKKGLFGLINKVVVETIYLPRGFNHQKELVKGREYKF